MFLTSISFFPLIFAVCPRTHSFVIVRLLVDVVFMLLLVASDIIGECCGGCYDVRAQRSGHCHVIFFLVFFSPSSSFPWPLPGLASDCVVTITSPESSGQRSQYIYIYLWNEVTQLFSSTQIQADRTFIIMVVYSSKQAGLNFYF